jgi:hypothetical protein
MSISQISTGSTPFSSLLPKEGKDERSQQKLEQDWSPEQLKSNYEEHRGNFPAGDLRSTSQKLKRSYLRSGKLTKPKDEQIIKVEEEGSKGEIEEEGWNTFSNSMQKEYGEFSLNLGSTDSKTNGNANSVLVYIAFFLGKISIERALELLGQLKQKCSETTPKKREYPSLTFEIYYGNWLQKRIFNTKYRGVQGKGLSTLRILVTLTKMGKVCDRVFEACLQNLEITDRTLDGKKYICKNAITITAYPRLDGLVDRFRSIRVKEGDNAIEKFLQEKFKNNMSIETFVTRFREDVELFLLTQFRRHPDALALYPLDPFGEVCPFSEEMTNGCWEHLFAVQEKDNRLPPEGYAEFLRHMFHISDKSVVSCLFSIFEYLQFLSNQDRQETLIRIVAQKFNDSSPITLISLFLCYQKRNSRMADLASNPHKEKSEAAFIDKTLEETLKTFRGVPTRGIPITKLEAELEDEKGWIQKMTTLQQKLKDAMKSARPIELPSSKKKKVQEQIAH